MTELRPPRNPETHKHCLETQYGPEQWPPIDDIARPAGAVEPELLDAVLKHAPHRPPSAPRTLHGAGATAAVELRGPDGTVHGALLRLSVSARPLPGSDEPYIIGAGLRLDDDPRADLVLACEFTGVPHPWPLIGPMANRLRAAPEYYGRARSVEHVLAHEGQRALERNGMKASALFVPAARFAQRLGSRVGLIRFHPHPTLMEPPEEEDFRVALSRIAVGTTLFSLELASGRSCQGVLQSPFVASHYGDHELMFRHDFDLNTKPTGRTCPLHDAVSAST